MKYAWMILTGLALMGAGCEDKLTQPEAERTSLVGRWKQTEYLADPGDGSGKWQASPENAAETLEFTADGRLRRDGTDFSRYRLSGDTIILDIQQRRASRWYIVSLSANRLEIRFPCIEPCGGRYVPVK